MPGWPVPISGNDFLDSKQLHQHQLGQSKKGTNSYIFELGYYPGKKRSFT